MTPRVSTVYLPDKKHPVLPSHSLSDGLCSLQAGVPRPCLVMKQVVDAQGVTGEATMNWGQLRVSRNCVYGEPWLGLSPAYRLLETVARAQMGDPAADSHAVVAYWMTQFNLLAADMLDGMKLGLYRVAGRTPRQAHISAGLLSEGAKRAAMHWGMAAGQTVAWEHRAPHGGIQDGTRLYAQASSPIRRVPDLVNAILIGRHLGAQGSGPSGRSPASIAWADSWMTRTDETNRWTKSCRKV